MLQTRELQVRRGNGMHFLRRQTSVLKTLLCVFTLVFLSLSQEVIAEDIFLKCTNGEFTDRGYTGRKDNTKFHNETGTHKDISMKITDRLCIFDWGNSIADFRLVRTTDDKYLCAATKDKGSSKLVARDKMQWQISLNRYSGQLKFQVIRDYEDLNGYINTSDYLLIFSCSKASKMF